jgi:hypothetical protein
MEDLPFLLLQRLQMLLLFDFDGAIILLRLLFCWVESK